MPEFSTVDPLAKPPRVDFPSVYNAAHDLIGRNLQAGRADKIAFIDDAGSYSYGELAQRVNRFANAITALGVQPEQRVFLCLLDSIDWPVAFLGCILAGVVPGRSSQVTWPRTACRCGNSTAGASVEPADASASVTADAVPTAPTVTTSSTGTADPAATLQRTLGGFLSQVLEALSSAGGTGRAEFSMKWKLQVMIAAVQSAPAASTSDAAGTRLGTDSLQSVASAQA